MCPWSRLVVLCFRALKLKANPSGVTARRTGADVTHRAFEAAQDHRTCDLARGIVAVARSHAVSSGDL